MNPIVTADAGSGSVENILVRGFAQHLTDAFTVNFIWNFGRLFEYLQTNELNFPVIHHLKFPAASDRYSR